MDIVTRWNSTLDMLERMCILQEPLEAALGLLHNPVANLSESDWQALPDVIKILRPFKQLTEEMSSENKVTVSMVLAATESVISMFKNCYRNPILSKAALLDPRFKKLAFRLADESNYECAKTLLKTELEKYFNVDKQQTVQSNKVTPAIFTDTNEDSIWKDFDARVTSNSVSNSTVSSIVTMRQYFEERILSRNECPLKWWQARALLYPELSILAEKYLSIMATSGPSERTFSKSGQIQSEKRCSIQPKRMEKVLFLNMNKRLLR
ncbi:zinc finger BED domain-containing protein 1-like [Stegodyphus dumicola]|uniref:zinc finger BED domain-containing protein 1-like n=1 Tax=Stegodyphus dumicola TaxID=202533 RepID=UPI0015AE3843|nr:zinc finger BED domain-containing protein 1-like [Stegodyphus dumicola]